MKTQYYCLLEDSETFTKTPIKPHPENTEINTQCLENTVLELADVACWTNIYTFYQAMGLAFFLIPLKNVAAQIAQEAINLAKIKSAERKAHRKRWFAKEKYQEGGGPTGLLMHENQFIQTMVYQESEKYEKYQERIATQDQVNLLKTETKSKADDLFGSLDELPILQMDWIIRYLKSLVLFSNNNSSDLVTAIACLVCNFQPKDAATLHAFFDGISPNYCSKRKLLLMNRLKERFPNLIVCKEGGKRTYFDGQDQVNSKWSSLVEDFFTQIVPWGTRCADITQPNVSFVGSKVEKLIGIFRKSYIFEEDHQQMSYLHASICPKCFLQLISETRLDCPRERLSLPVFLTSQMNNLNNNNLNTQNTMAKIDRQLKLTKAELMEVVESASKYLSKESERRENLLIKKLGFISDDHLLPIFINDQEQTFWEVTRNKEAWFKLEGNCNLAKIVSWDKEGSLVIGLLELNSNRIKNSWQHKLLGWTKDTIVLNKSSIDIVVKLSETENKEEFFIGAKYKTTTKEFNLSSINLKHLPNLWFSIPKQQLALLALLIILCGILLLPIKPFFIDESEIANNNPKIFLPKSNTRGNQTTVLPTKIQPEPLTQLTQDSISFNFSSASNFPSKTINLLKLEIPRNIANIQIHLPISSMRYEKYLVVIKSKEQSNILTSRSLVAKSSKDSQLTISVPSHIFISGQEYNLTIKGIDKGIEKELEQYNLILEFLQK